MSKHRYYYDRVTMALDDLSRSQRYCNLMLKLPLGKSFSEERTLYESLFVAFIVSYGRVFTTSNTVDIQFKKSVSNDFGNYRDSVLKKQENYLQILHKRIITERDTAIAHSDGNSRNYQHYGDTPLAIGRNPYFPYKHDEVETVLALVNNLISQIGDEQTRVGKLAFSKSFFGEVQNDTE